MAASVRIATLRLPLIVLTASKPEHVQKNRATPRRRTDGLRATAKLQLDRKVHDSNTCPLSAMFPNEAHLTLIVMFRILMLCH